LPVPDDLPEPSAILRALPMQPEPGCPGVRCVAEAGVDKRHAVEQFDPFYGRCSRYGDVQLDLPAPAGYDVAHDRGIGLHASGSAERGVAFIEARPVRQARLDGQVKAARGPARRRIVMAPA